MKGVIVKGIGGFYYVKSGAGTFQCRARGIFKKDGVTPTVGDDVDFEPLDSEEGVVNAILPRKNVFIRPPIANVDCFIVMAAAAQPKPNLAVLDRFLVAAEHAGADAVLILNKVDLADAETVRKVTGVYENIYSVIEASCVTGHGLDRLPPLMKGRRCALAGPSGAGKSTLLNMLQGGLDLETGAVSRKTSRGRHTTRHTELFEMDFGGEVFDTPGFTSFDTGGIKADELASCFPEMSAYLGRCRFDNCRHMQEPGCAVAAAAAAGELPAARYESYLRQLGEIMEAGRH